MKNIVEYIKNILDDDSINVKIKDDKYIITKVYDAKNLNTLDTIFGVLKLRDKIKIESKLTNVQNPADTHINACAVLSQLGRHQTALEHAQNALILLQEELLSPPGVVSGAAPQADRIAVLAIAYHNIGVEQEFLKRYEHSVLSYKKGVEVAERYLGTK